MIAYLSTANAGERLVSSDSGDAAEIADLFGRVAKEHGGLDVLFLNAGILRVGTIAAMDEAIFDEEFTHDCVGLKVCRERTD